MRQRADENLPSDDKEKVLSIEKKVFCDWAQEVGFAQVGFCSIERFLPEQQKVDSQPHLAERRQLRFSPGDDEVWGKSLAVMLWPYYPPEMPNGEGLFVDSYYQASNTAYHAARMLEERLIDAGYRVKANVSYPAKAAAVRAGLGWIGKNDLLFTQKYGTRVVIILMLTELEPDRAVDTLKGQQETCLSCGLCAKVCPSGALDENGMSHPERCMRNFMMEGIVVPEHLRVRMGMRLLGCDLCQKVCPLQPDRSECVSGQHYDLKCFVTEDPQLFSQSVALLASEIGRNAARPQRIRAQVALLAGNSRNPAYLPVLRQWERMPFDAVKEHARWAIERIESDAGV